MESVLIALISAITTIALAYIAARYKVTTNQQRNSTNALAYISRKDNEQKNNTKGGKT